MNLSFGFRRVTTSYNKNITCPPSSAGIGKIFMKAKITDRKAVIFQKAYQSHIGGKKLPIAPNPPKEDAPWGVNTYLN